ncbi:N(4)-(beta-N-acetylglucosaminyl)-L-asparaginase [Candidatus Palauibacter sp.]|uniref:N(4)-(beta-N-acetylglucosaminyl)-L-asparaginase n=1 Tax=Candidatus Palauibacter sp. TaxID=3101350 RepID=UPI003B51F7C7
MSMDRRDFVRTSAAGLAAAATPATLAAERRPLRASARVEAPAVHGSRAARPIVVSDLSGIRFNNGGPESSVERAFRGIVEGEDVLDALTAGVNIPENDPTELGIGYGGLPNADGVVQLDACCMHGPRRWAGGVAALEGVRTPSLVAKAVAELTDHHLLVGAGAQAFARQLGFEIEDDLNTEASRTLWLEWRRRIDPGHWLDPRKRLEAGLSMVDDGLIPAHSFWGTTNCNAVNAEGDICGVTTTSGLSWKIPGRTGDSPILGAGLYVDNDVGAVGSTGRGEANLYNLSSFLAVEFMRQGMSPLDAGMATLQRIQSNTVESRLLNARGLPNFDVRFFLLDKQGETAGVAMYGSAETHYAVCTENGAEERPLEGLLEGSPRDA